MDVKGVFELIAAVALLFLFFGMASAVFGLVVKVEYLLAGKQSTPQSPEGRNNA